MKKIREKKSAPGLQPESAQGQREKVRTPMVETMSTPLSVRDDSTTPPDLVQEVREKWEPKKRSSQNLADVYTVMHLDNRAARVAECGSFLEFGVTETGSKLQTANFCRDRLCPMCNWRRSLKIFSQVSRILDLLESQGSDFVFLTLTIKNVSGADLPAAIDQLQKGFAKLLRHKEVKAAVTGSFRSLEVTRNANGTYHPHLHSTLAVRSLYWTKGYITQRRWSELWAAACGLDYTPIVDVRRIKPGKDGSHAAAAAEVCKYAVKDADYLGSIERDGTLNDALTAVGVLLDALTGRRLCSFTGCFIAARKALRLDDAENGDLVLTDADQLRPELVTAIVRYHWRSGFYAQI